MATVLMQIKVKPKARASSLTQAPDGTWLAKLKSPPVPFNRRGRAKRAPSPHARPPPPPPSVFPPPLCPGRVFPPPRKTGEPAADANEVGRPAPRAEEDVGAAVFGHLVLRRARQLA